MRQRENSPFTGPQIKVSKIIVLAIKSFTISHIQMEIPRASAIQSQLSIFEAHEIVCEY